MNLNPHIQIQNKQHAEVLQKLSTNILLLGKAALPNMFAVKSPEFHQEIANLIMNERNGKIVFVAPRGHAKSSIIACLLPLWHIFFHKDNKVILIISKTQTHSIRLLQTIKNALEFSMSLRALFGYWGEHSALAWKQDEVVLKDGTLIVCKGAGQQVIGLKHGDQRPTLIILDDPEDMENTKTAERMEENLKWLLQEVLPSRDPLRGRVIVIGTPQHQRCLVETLKVMKGWVARKWKAIQDDGTVLWPEWMSKDMLLKEKASLESIGRVSSFYREYQCEIIGDEDQLFRDEYLRYWDGSLVLVGREAFLDLTYRNGEVWEKPLRIPVNVFVGIDPASSVAQTADYSTYVPVAVDAERNRYILPYVRRRVSPMALAELILEKDAEYKPKKTRIESAGYQEMLREWLRQKRVIPGLEIRENPRSPKNRRLETLQPFFYQGMVYLKRNQMSELRDELLMYPRGKHDDLLDGLFYAMKGNYPPTHSIGDLMTAEDLGWTGERSSWLHAK